jgi:hypothetical protein
MQKPGNAHADPRQRFESLLRSWRSALNVSRSVSNFRDDTGWTQQENERAESHLIDSMNEALKKTLETSPGTHENMAPRGKKSASKRTKR